MRFFTYVVVQKPRRDRDEKIAHDDCRNKTRACEPLYLNSTSSSKLDMHIVWLWVVSACSRYPKWLTVPSSCLDIEVQLTLCEAWYTILGSSV
jgi:hypothetical protein